jgi:HdeA/HdeB family protein
MKTLHLFLVAAVTTAPLPTYAGKIDLTQMKWGQFVQASSESKSTITAWLAGYYTDVSDTEVIDLNGLKDTGSRLSAFCEANPNFDMSSAAEGMLGK